MQEFASNTVQRLAHRLNNSGHFGRAAGHDRLAHETIHEITGYAENDDQDNDVLDRLQLRRDELDHAARETVAQHKKQAHPRHRVDAVGQQELRQRQARDARGQKNRRPNSGRQPREQQYLDAVLVKVLGDARQLFRRQQVFFDEGTLDQPRAPEPADAVQKTVADHDADDAHRQHDPPVNPRFLAGESARQRAAQNDGQLLRHRETQASEQNAHEHSQVSPALQKTLHASSFGRSSTARGYYDRRPML